MPPRAPPSTAYDEAAALLAEADVAEAGALHEVVDAQRRPGARPAAGGQDAVGAEAEIGDGDRRVLAEQDLAGMVDAAQVLERLGRQDLQMLGRVVVDEAQRLVPGGREHDAAARAGEHRLDEAAALRAEVGDQLGQAGAGARRRPRGCR